MVEIEPPQRSQHWSNERLHADAVRAVGGVMNLVREVARISHRIDSTIPADWMIKRIQFLGYELQTLARHAATEGEKLNVLNKFFFESKKFRCEPNSYRLNRILIDRAGAPLILELLYAHLADRIGVTLEFVDLKPTCFLKWYDAGRSRFIDISRGGSTLSTDELIETLHTRFSMTSFTNTTLLDAFSFESFIADYVASLKRHCEPATHPELLMFLQDTLIAYLPSNLYLIGERALLHRRLGNFKQALADLKRYFAFHERDRAPTDLVQLHDELTQLERSKTTIEVLE